MAILPEIIVVKHLNLPIKILRCPWIVVVRTDSENILLTFANVSAFFIKHAAQIILEGMLTKWVAHGNVKSYPIAGPNAGLNLTH